ncbi:unnamed protein product [Lymnaea stagnalis]|uniref:Uncharacterized protein n=1 Tax=Lymnaea stagnalis TaxID=6523 RepID=A0AAV2HX00_LYMST
MTEEAKESIEMDQHEEEAKDAVEEETQPIDNSDSNEVPEPEELPPLTYVDFTPKCLGSTIVGKEPDFAEFGTVIEEANEWLEAHPQFTVYKCETLASRLGADFNIDGDVSLVHVSSNGRNVFLRSLRVWLIPTADPTAPVQKIGYITALPDHSSGDLQAFLNSLTNSATSRQIGDITFPSFDTLTQTVEKLNRHLQSKPIPGRILCMETLTFKCMEANTSDKLATEASTWSEGGSNAKVFLHGFRVFYILGKPCFESVGYYDEVPDIFQSKDGLALKLKFATFDQTLSKAASWLKKQSGFRIVNIQSVTVKLERKYGQGPWILDPTIPGYTDNPGLTESRFTKIIRIAYVKEQKLNNPLPYAQVTLTSRLFIPCRVDGRLFETMSKTIMRVMKWLSKTRLPVFACETVRYHLTNDSEGQGFNNDRLDSLINSYQGQHYLTCIRLYFPCTFEEPQPDPADPEDLGWGWGWACVVS